MFVSSSSGFSGSAEDYRLLFQQAQALTADEPDLLANLANISALIYDQLPQLNWAGFYLNRGQTLVLGPFQGKPACVRIKWHQGVCGTAAATQKVQRVADVHSVPGHIACDAASAAEIVLPVVVQGTTVAVLDLDSPHQDRFQANDEEGLAALLPLLQEFAWEQL